MIQRKRLHNLARCRVPRTHWIQQKLAHARTPRAHVVLFSAVPVVLNVCQFDRAKGGFLECREITVDRTAF